MSGKALDARLSEPDTYIRDGNRLVLVLIVRWMGKSPARQRVTVGEDAMTGDIVNLTDEQLADYEFVCRTTDDQTTEPVEA